MRKYLSFLFLLFASSFLFSQSNNLEWFRNFGSAPNTDATIRKSLMDENGNIYNIGRFTFYSNFMDNTATNAVIVNGQNSYVAKYSPSGQLLWSNNFGGEVVDFAFDNNGDLIVTGGFATSATFNDNTTFTSSLSGQPQLYNIKLNKNTGTYIWKQTFSNSIMAFSPATGMGVTVLSDNSIVVCTRYYGNMAGIPAFQLMKFDANGNNLVKKVMDNVNNSGTEFNGLQSDNADNIYLIGSFYSMLNLDVNGGMYKIEDPSLSSSLTAFIAKYDSNFNVLWGKAIGGPSADQAIALAVDKATQKSYFSLTVNGNNVNLNNGGTTPVLTNFWQTQSSGVLLNYDGSGTLLTHHIYTGSGLNVGQAYADDIQLKGSTLVLSGRVYDKPDIDISSGSEIPPSNSINERIRFFVSVFNVNGNTYSLTKSRYFAIDMNNAFADPSIIGHVVPNTSKLIVAGDNNSLIPYQGTELLSHPKHSAFMFQFDTQALDTKEVSGNASSLFVGSDSNNKIAKIISKEALEYLTVYDAAGRKILDTNNTEIDISNFKEGIYFFQIKTTTRTVTKKFQKK